MISIALRQVLTVYGHADADITELTDLLTGDQQSPELRSFPQDLAEAIHGDELNPKVIAELTGREFDDQVAVDHWLHRAWAIWFPGQRYPR